MFYLRGGLRLGVHPTRRRRSAIMNNIIWLVGAIVIVIAILSFLGLR
ncbi:hypothetical protein X772_17915 [Mesorhizobium sp. LSJC280B00]|nr:hypothetical protein X772_17915 [Mesorhizobium sp. LSJC280B00]